MRILDFKVYGLEDAIIVSGFPKEQNTQKMRIMNQR